MYGPAVSLFQAPACTEFPLREDGEGLSGGNLSDNSFSKLGTYAGIFDNLSPSIASMNNPIPNVCPSRYPSSGTDSGAPEVPPPPPPPGRLGKPRGYSQTRTGSVPQTSTSKIPPSPPHLHLLGHTLRCIPPLVGRNGPGLLKKFHKWKKGWNTLQKHYHGGWKGLSSPRMPAGIGGWGGGGQGKKSGGSGP